MSDTDVPQHDSDVYDEILNALKAYDGLFGESLTGAELSAAWKELKATPEPVKTHMDLRLRYLQAKATAELGADLAELREMANANVRRLRVLAKAVRDVQEPLLDACDDLAELRRVWSDEDPTEAAPETAPTAEASVESGNDSIPNEAGS